MRRWFLICVLSSLNVLAQNNCATDEYLNALNSIDGTVKTSIKNEISKIIANRKLKRKTFNPRLNNDDFVITIPVVFNLVYPYHYPLGQGANIDGSTLQTQINILNNRFAGGRGGVDTKIRFCLARKNIYGIESTGIKRYTGEASYQPLILSGNINQNFLQVDSNIKQHRDPGFPSDSFLNIWVVDLKYHDGSDNLSGYSSTPIPEYNQNLPIIDGVVIDYDEVNKFTASHEVGHWLGLFHIFSNKEILGGDTCNEVDCETQGDFICDTDSVPDEGTFNIAPGSCKGYNCNGQISDVVQNYMDYHTRAREICYSKFTLNQKERMRDVLELRRATIYNNSFLNLNNYCQASGGSSGGNGHSSNAGVCQTCYVPSVKIPVNLDYNGSFYQGYKGNLYVNLRSSDNPPFNKELRVYRKNCSSLNEEAFFNLEPSSPYGFKFRIFIINDNKFVIERRKSINLEGNYSELIIFKKINQEWLEEKRITTTGFSFFNKEHSSYLVTNTAPINTRHFYRFDIETESRAYVPSATYNPVNDNFLVMLTSEGYQVHKNKGLTIEKWKYVGNGNYNLTSIEDFNLPSPYSSENFELLPSEIKGEHVIFTGSEPNKPFDHYIYVKNTFNKWEVLQHISSGGLVHRDLSIIESNYLWVYYPSYGCGGGTITFKKNSSGIFERINNLNHINPNSSSNTTVLRGKIHAYNESHKELLINDQILKLSDLFQDEGLTTSTQICNNINNSITASEINIGGDCSVNLNNSVDILATNEITIKPNTTINADGLLLAVSPSFNCNFSLNCTYNTKISGKREIERHSKKNDYYKIIETSNKLILYPNPNSNGILNIRNFDNLSEIKIFNLSGILIYQTKNVKKQITIPNFKRGVYNVQLFSKTGKVINEKLILSN